MAAEEVPFARALSLAVHEFRTPVTVVAGYLRMLLREQAGSITDKQRKMLEEAERSCGRLRGLVDEMSDLGKLESGALTLARQELDLAELLTELASHMHEGVDRGVRLEIRAATRPAMVNGDRARLSTALRALLHSAMRERGEAGAVVAECSVVRESDGSVALVTIGDTSVLPALAAARHQPPAFNEWLGGMGFALPLARRIIEAHGGALWSADGSQSKAASALKLPLSV